MTVTGNGPWLRRPSSASSDCVVVQLSQASGDTLVSGNDYNVTFTIGDASPQQIDTNSLWNGTDTITIDADTAGYWEWDAIARFVFDASSAGWQFSVTIDIPSSGERVKTAYSQVDPGGAGVTVAGEIDVVTGTWGRNMIDGDTVKLLLVAIASNPSFNHAAIRGRRVCDTLPILT